MSAKPKTGKCLDCAQPITAKAKRCSRCSTLFVNTDPTIKERRKQAIRKKWQDPAHRAKMAPICRRNGQVAAADPEHRAWLIQHGKRQAALHLHTPEGRAANQAARARAGKARSETVMAWCWPELRDEYYYWTRSRRMLSADARALIEKKMADIEAARSPDLPSAIEWLRRLAPIKRLDDGRYQHGHAILTAGEAMARAKFRGWQPFNPVKQPVDNGGRSQFSANSNEDHGRTNREMKQGKLAA